MDFKILPLLRKYFEIALHTQKRSLIWVFATSLLIATSKLAIPFVMQSMLQMLVDDQSNYKEFSSALVLMALIMIVGTVFRYVRDQFNADFQLGVMQELYIYSFRYIHGHSTRFFNNNYVGALQKKVNRYVFGFEAIADRVTFFFLPFFVELLVMVVMLWGVHKGFALLMLCFVTVFMGISIYGMIKKVPLDIDATVSQTRVSAQLADSLSNAFTIKVFASLKREVSKFSDITSTYSTFAKKAWLFDSDMHFIGNTVSLVYTVLMYGMFYIAVRYQGLDASVLIVLFGLDQTLKNRVWDLGSQLRRFYSEAAYSMEMLEILQKPHEIEERSEDVLCITRSPSIRFDKVTFSYGDAKVFDDFSLEIAPGEKVALVGTSGSGKTTLVKLLLRLMDVDSGTISIDGNNITAFSKASVRNCFNKVSQSDSLFGRSIAENIAYGKPNATLAEIQEAAKAASAHDFITRLPQGYQTLVGERGVKLSGGQRQRVSIARVILKNSPITILDESTSALDSVTEDNIQQSIESVLEHHTAIVIAHRLSTVKHVDRIIVMEEGRIVEQGTHEELSSDPTSKYSTFWNLQNGASTQHKKKVLA